MPKGAAQIAAQVAEKLCKATLNFSHGATILLSDPESRLVRREGDNFKTLLFAYIRQHRPSLTIENIQLRMKLSEIEFNLGMS